MAKASSSVSDISRPVKRTYSDGESSFHTLTTAPKKSRYEVQKNESLEDKDHADQIAAKEESDLRGDVRGTSETDREEQTYVSKYIGVRWSSKKAKWRCNLLCFLRFLTAA
jgi:hypothetical protein